jgi:hypothetical protein
MPISARNQRIRVYHRTNTGADGLVATGYQFDQEVWGRAEPATAREVALAQQPDMRIDYVVLLPASAGITGDGVLKFYESAFQKDVVLDVAAILPRRATREVQVFAVYSAPEVFNALIES